MDKFTISALASTSMICDNLQPDPQSATKWVNTEHVDPVSCLISSWPKDSLEILVLHESESYMSIMLVTRALVFDFRGKNQNTESHCALFQIHSK